MEPITLATVTAAVTTLAMECARNIATEAGQDLWIKVKKLFGWDKEPPPPDLAPQIATRLTNDEALARRLVELLKRDPKAGAVTSLIGNLNIQAGKVAIVQGDVHDGFHM